MIQLFWKLCVSADIFWFCFSFHFVIFFSDPPVVTVKPDNVTVNETGEFLLFCEYEANPASLKQVKW